jgi:hypothetical protein
VDVLSRRKNLKGTGMMDPDVTMSREEIAAFLASLKKPRDGLDDDLNNSYATLNFSNGWEADIRSSRLNDASAPRRDIRRLPLLAANRGRKRSCPHRDRTRPEASENW